MLTACCGDVITCCLFVEDSLCHFTELNKSVAKARIVFNTDPQWLQSRSQSR